METIVHRTQYASRWFWTEGNGCCDCNREICFGVDNDDNNCEGSHRYLVIDSDDPDFDYFEYNQYYSKDVVEIGVKFIKRIDSLDKLLK